MVVFLLMASTTTIIAQRLPHKSVNSGSWRLIGTTRVSGGGGDNDILRLNGPGDNFRKLKFKVTDSGLNMLRMEVVYDNGGRQKVEIRQNINKGGESRIIDLNGGKRSIRSIKFWYTDKGFLNGKAKVTVFGRK